jgi:enamine deaminase RidA (YjgF/YER057c/UK114 family)
MLVEQRLADIGLTLPRAPEPVAAYVPCKKSGDQVQISGQGPAINQVLKYSGKVGKELNEEQGKESARNCGLNLLAQLKRFVGDLDLVEEILNIRVYVASSDQFYNQPQVANGVSGLMAEVFGEKGRHTRCALGVNVLPGNIPVEAEMLVRVRQETHG